MTNLEIAQHYFDLSNQRNLDGIADMLTKSTTYSSPNVGVFLGKEAIMEMKQSFYGSFLEMHQDVSNIEEIKPGVILFTFIFSGTTTDDDSIERPGQEYVIVFNGRLQHIEVKNV